MKGILPIKTERDVETRLKIKTDRDIETRLKIKSEPKNILTAIQNNWQAEKKSLIDKIVALKSENHHNVITLKKTQAELSKLLLEKQKLEKELSEKDVKFSEEIKNHKLGILSIKNEMFEREKCSEKIISDLKREKKTLTARINQYKTGMTQQKIFEKQQLAEIRNESQEFEVESIRDHKITRGCRKYLIHWKGFDSTEDSWQKESDLHCPTLLNEYDRSVQMNKQKL